ncbi:MAG: hypothetical protein ACM3YO_04960 [Bacteroidota bacterium]
MFEIFKLFNRDPLGSITPEQLKEVLQSIESKYNALQDENQDLGTKLRDSLTQIAHLEQEKNETKSKLADLETARAEFEAKQLERESEETRSTEEWETKLQELRDRLLEQEAESARKLEEWQTRLKTVEEERNGLLQKIPEQESLLAAIDDQGRALEERLVELKKTVDALEKEEAVPDPALLQTIEEQRGRIIVFEEEIQKLAAIAQHVENQVALQTEVERLEAENTRLKAENEEHLAAIAASKKRAKTGRLQSLETEKTLLEEHVRELEQRMPDFDKLAALLSEKEVALQALQESHIEIQDRLEQLSQENERLLSESQRLEGSLADAEARSEADRTLIRELETEVGRLMAGETLERKVPAAKPTVQPRTTRPVQPKATAPAKVENKEDRRAKLAKMVRR